MEGGVSQQAVLMQVIAPTWGEGEEERKWNQPAQPHFGPVPSSTSGTLALATLSFS